MTSVTVVLPTRFFLSDAQRHSLNPHLSRNRSRLTSQLCEQAHQENVPRCAGLHSRKIVNHGKSDLNSAMRIS